MYSRSCLSKSAKYLSSVVSKSLGKLDKGEIQLKDKQNDALKTIVLEKKDTLCVSPTGYSKTIIYQQLPFMFECYDVGADSCILFW